MKLCINCKHFKPELWCKSPANGVNPVDGSPNPEWAIIARKEGGKCGPYALGFEPLPEQPKSEPAWWQRILGLKS